jgi:hypothetical protein
MSSVISYEGDQKGQSITKLKTNPLNFNNNSVGPNINGGI